MKMIWVVALALAGAVAGCSYLVPGYKDELATLKSAYQSVKVEKNQAENKAKQLERDMKNTAAKLAALDSQLQNASSPAAVEEFEATIGLLKSQRAQMSIDLEQAKHAAAVAQGRAEERARAIDDFQASSAGQSVVGVTETIGGIIALLGGMGWLKGAKAAKLAAQANELATLVKSGPSRAQVAVDEQWDEISAMKEKLSRTLALVEAGMTQPPPSGIITSPPVGTTGNPA